MASGWLLLMAPAGTPDIIVQKISKDLRLVIAQPDLIERFAQLGTYTRDMNPTQTETFMRNEEKLWWPIVRQIKAQP